MSLKSDLAERVRKLELRRTELEARRTNELAKLDAEIAGASLLLARWDTLTIDQGLAALEAAGLRVRVDG